MSFEGVLGFWGFGVLAMMKRGEKGGKRWPHEKIA